MSNKKKQIRDNFRTAVFSRDGHKCKFCGCTENLDAHHITDRTLMPAGGYVVENGITLCPVHHQMAEEWHVTGGRSVIEGFTPTDLYKKIFSTYEKALAASHKLVAKIERQVRI